MLCVFKVYKRVLDEIFNPLHLLWPYGYSYKATVGVKGLSLLHKLAKANVQCSALTCK